ncbi:MAG TPA: hypothetical protein VML75_25070 [Kofleriaceae bacterium]|nr:hypothetical protein [Kofleriaceae bacterium]
MSTSPILRTLGVVTFALAASACTGDIVDTVTTDFGDAIATSERSDRGDISSWLTTRSQQRTLASLEWHADSGDLVGDIAGQPLAIAETMELSLLPIEELNLLVYTLWEVEVSAPSSLTCVSNAALLCCRDEAWSCRARRE